MWPTRNGEINCGKQGYCGKYRATINFPASDESFVGFPTARPRPCPAFDWLQFEPIPCFAHGLVSLQFDSNDEEEEQEQVLRRS